MKKKVVLILLSTVLAGTALFETLSVFAENSNSLKVADSFKKVQKNEIKIGKITAIEDNVITVALAEKPEINREERIQSQENESVEKEEKIKPQIKLTGETISVTLDDTIKIRTDLSDEGDISSLSVDTMVSLIYDENEKLIEISTGMFGRHRVHSGDFERKFDNDNCKIGKITAIEDNAITVALAEKPEMNREERIQPQENESEKEEKIKPQIKLTGETISVTLDDTIKIKTNSSDENDISSLSVDTIVSLIYDENEKLIEISTGMFGRHRGHSGDFERKFDDDNCKIGKITAIEGNAITVALAEKPEMNREERIKPQENESVEKEEKIKPQIKLTGETISITLDDTIKIKTDSSDEDNISLLSVDTIVNLIYDENEKLVEIFLKHLK